MGLRQVRADVVRPVLVATTMTALLAAGCGGRSEERLSEDVPPAMSHEQYQQAIDTIMSSDDTRAATRLFTDAVATSYEKTACEERVRALHERLNAILHAVEDLHPPADAQDAQNDFLQGARESVRIVRVAADDVGTGALACGQPLNQRIYALPSTKKSERAIQELAQRGYRVFGD
ncbi:MAG: hypothetical protein QOE05_77 [Actinomycetota bacterium]|jgi:hypothetical protein|nr:hypothetical protein [Actinomycetota bacterium]